MKIENKSTCVEIELLSASVYTSGYGNKKITVELQLNGQKKEFSSITNNMPAWDASQDLDDFNDKTLALYEIIEKNVEDSITEWIKEVNKYFVISYSFGDNVEYYNSAMVHDDFSTKLIENAEGFETEQDAKDVLENTVKPYASQKGWEVAFFIDEVY